MNASYGVSEGASAWWRPLAAAAVGGVYGSRLRHLVKRDGRVFCFGSLDLQYLWLGPELVVAKDRWGKMCDLGWPSSLGVDGVIDCVVDVPWRDWASNEALWVCEDGDSAYLSSRKWRHKAVSIPVVVLRPVRRVCVHVMPSGAEFGDPTYCTAALEDCVECVYANNFYGVRDEVYEPIVDDLLLGHIARKIWDAVMPADGGLRWRRVEVVSRQRLLDMRGGKALPYV